MGARETSFVFVCQQGELELQAMLLAASLREYARCDQELVAAVPGPAEAWGTPCEDTLQLLKKLDVRVIQIANPIGTAYPIGNKLACLSIPTTAAKRIFLDSDMVALSTFADDACFDAPFAARLAAELPCEDGIEQLRCAFAAAGCTLPEVRIRTMLGTPIPPYFNAGLIAVDAAIPLAPLWVECCQRIEADASVTCKRPFLDQLGLAAAVCRLGLDYHLLDMRYNWPRRLPLAGRDLPVLLHYRDPDVFGRDPRVRTAVATLARRHPEIRRVAAKHPGWELLAGKATVGERFRAWMGG
jgi:hypothetical protein